MKVFILEDDARRMKTLRRKLHTHTIYHADNVAEAKKLLEETEGIEVLLLDHDLGGQVYVDSHQENTGYQLAKYIRDSERQYLQIIIHSLNVVGARKMYNELEKSTPNLRMIPYPSLVLALN
jgi:CheY-like chemotaxis protein